jgi:hypothetical protein
MFTSLPPVPKVDGAMATRVFVFNTCKNVIDDVLYKKTVLTNVVHKFKFLDVQSTPRVKFYLLNFFLVEIVLGFT